MRHKSSVPWKTVSALPTHGAYNLLRYPKSRVTECQRFDMLLDSESDLPTVL